MSSISTHKHWGIPPWRVDFVPPRQAIPAETDFAIIGGGFTGLAAAAWLRLLAPEKSVVLLEAGKIGAGASGRTGGMVLGESAAGDLPGLGDVLAGFTSILKKLEIDCDLSLPGAWEISRSGPDPDSDIVNPPTRSSIDWNDSGRLRVVNQVPGGMLDPGKLVSRLAHASHQSRAAVFENQRVTGIRWDKGIDLQMGEKSLRAEKVLFATNALSLGLAGLESGTDPRLTLAARTAPLREEVLEEIGLAERKPFYTVDFPYLWGRVCLDNSIVWGAGLVDAPASRDLEEVSVDSEKPARMFASFENRVRNLHPALHDIDVTHQWGGPILFRENWDMEPVFSRHPASPDGIVLGAYAGHGVALSSYLGAWAAEVMLGRRELPTWGKIGTR